MFLTGKKQWQLRILYILAIEKPGEFCVVVVEKGGKS